MTPPTGAGGLSGDRMSSIMSSSEMSDDELDLLGPSGAESGQSRRRLNPASNSCDMDHDEARSVDQSGEERAPEASQEQQRAQYEPGEQPPGGAHSPPAHLMYASHAGYALQPPQHQHAAYAHHQQHLAPTSALQPHLQQQQQHSQQHQMQQHQHLHDQQQAATASHQQYQDGYFDQFAYYPAQAYAAATEQHLSSVASAYSADKQDLGAGKPARSQPGGGRARRSSRSRDHDEPAETSAEQPDERPANAKLTNGHCNLNNNNNQLDNGNKPPEASEQQASNAGKIKSDTKQSLIAH